MTVLALVNPHHGVILPAARVIVVLAPVAVMCFYVFIVKARRGK